MKKVLYMYNNLDLENVGYIIAPGADAINHESIVGEHPDVAKGMVFFVKGKIEVRAGRAFKTGEEFTINYNVYSSVYETFKQYGYIKYNYFIDLFLWKLYTIICYSGMML